jgi:hypothetical protein
MKVERKKRVFTQKFKVAMDSQNEIEMLIKKWLKDHEIFNPSEIDAADYRHFVEVLNDCCSYVVKEYLKEEKQFKE